jgi:DNA modification methylase
MNDVIHGDCLDVMRTMPDDSVDLVITSPPYEDARTSSNHHPLLVSAASEGETT